MVTPGCALNSAVPIAGEVRDHWNALVTDCHKYAPESTMSRFLVVAPAPVLEAFLLNCVFNEMFPSGKRTLTSAVTPRVAITAVAKRLQCMNNCVWAAAANFRLCCAIREELAGVLDVPSVLWRPELVLTKLRRRVFQMCDVPTLTRPGTQKILLLSTFPEFHFGQHLVVWSPDSVNAYVGPVEARKRRTLAWYCVFKYLYRDIYLIRPLGGGSFRYFGSTAETFVALLNCCQMLYGIATYMSPRVNHFQTREAPLSMRYFHESVFRGGYSLPRKRAQADHRADLIAWETDSPDREWDQRVFVGTLISDKVRKRVKINDE